jgi:hypothetical protein
VNPADSADAVRHRVTCGSFCPDRYELSKMLPDVVRSLDGRKCLFTDRNNYFVLELPDPLPAGFEYWIFFDVRGVAEPDAVPLFIQSAYASDTRKSPRSDEGKRSDSGCWAGFVRRSSWLSHSWCGPFRAGRRGYGYGVTVESVRP